MQTDNNSRTTIPQRDAVWGEVISFRKRNRSFQRDWSDWTLVPHLINTSTFAARDFWPGRGASDAHTLQGSVRSEQRLSGPESTAARRVASLFGSGVVAPRSQPHCGGCSLVAPRQNRKSTQRTWSYL